MRILIIANASSIHTFRWVDYLIKEKYEVHLISNMPLNGSIHGLHFYLLPNPFSNLFLDFFLWQVHILMLHLEIKPDIIHAMYVSKYGWLLIPFLKHPQIISTLGDDVLVLPRTNIIYYLFTKLALKKADRIFSVSKSMCSVLSSYFQIPSDKIMYCPIGVNTDLFKPKIDQRNTDKREIIIFSNRGFREEYDPITIINAIEIIQDVIPNIKLVLKGDTHERNRIQLYVKLKKMENSIQFLDKTDYKSVPDDYRNADIFISAAISDGTPVSMLEAMASGLACIMTNVGGVPEWIQDGYNGFVFPPGQQDILAEKILFLINNPDERMRMGRKARITVVERGDWNTLMKVVEEDYYTLYQRYNPNYELEK